MLRYECLTCGKQSNDKKEYYEVGARVGIHTICKSCASELGYHNFFSVGLKNNTNLLKKYVKLHPEAQPRLERQLQWIKKENQELKEGFAKIVTDATKHSGCKKQEQTKCHCKSCGNTYFYSSIDSIKNIYNASVGNIYTINQLKDLSQCPKCGSRATEKKKVYFWVDKNNNCVDIEE